MGGGAWSFLVGGVICLVNSVNERDLGLLNSAPYGNVRNDVLLRGTCSVSRAGSSRQQQIRLPLDVLGRTRATLTSSAGRLFDACICVKCHPWLESLGNP